MLVSLQCWLRPFNASLRHSSALSGIRRCTSMSASSANAADGASSADDESDARAPYNTAVDLSDMRAPYNAPQQAFTEDQLVAREPFGQFSSWFEQLQQCADVAEPNAMCLSTATPDGRPSARFVLLKKFSADGFSFFTSYDSRKAGELDANPLAALTFYWPGLNRSVRVEGSVQRLPEALSDQYFHRRPHASQIGACLAPQSSPVDSRAALERTADQLRRQHPDPQPVPKPHWGGYILQPAVFEFWQGQSDRIHDRIRFRRAADVGPDEPHVRLGLDGWVYDRLAP